MRLYVKLQSKVQLTFATGDYYLCLIMQGVQGETEEYLDNEDLSKYSQLFIYALVAKGVHTHDSTLLKKAV